MDNNLQTISTEMDQIVDAFSADDATALMQASGQNIGGDRREGLSRLNINYDTETEDGHTLTRGDWKMFYEGEYIYAKEVFLQPILRTFEWSLFNAEEGNFSCKSIQKPTMTGDFPDTDGGTKCGRLPVDEEEKLKDDDPVRLRSRSAVCNQVIYGMISGSFVKGNKEKIDTQRQKKGSVTYWIPVPSLSSETEINDTDKELMKKFAETVKAHNENIMNQYRDAVKLISPAKDDDLAGDFSAANA